MPCKEPTESGITTALVAWKNYEFYRNMSGFPVSGILSYIRWILQAMINKLRKRQTRTFRKCILYIPIYAFKSIKHRSRCGTFGARNCFPKSRIFLPQATFLVTGTAGPNTLHPMFLMSFGELMGNFVVRWSQLAKESEHENVVRGVNISHAQRKSNTRNQNRLKLNFPKFK